MNKENKDNLYKQPVMDPETHKRFKIISAQIGISMKDLFRALTLIDLDHEKIKNVINS